jgi:hypothetical protein
MGTSTSSKGPGGSSPLVPPWADTDGLGPGPQSGANRFQGFRTNLGKFVSSGDRNYLHKALRHYAATSTGGAQTGARRFGAMAQVGGALYGVLNDLRANSPNLPVALRSLQGKSTDAAIEAIVERLVPENGDADRVRSALNDALSECLEGETQFDIASITDEMLVDVMLKYTASCIFEQIVLDSKDAFAKASPAQTETAEAELRALVMAAAELHMRPLLDQSVFTAVQLEQVQLHAIRDIWAMWQGWNP